MGADPGVVTSRPDERLEGPAAADSARRGSMLRRLDVQGLRAVAVLLVVAFHSGLPVPGGFVGVDVFFVISGYVIIALLYHEVSGTGRISLPRFFSRRVRRIMPALSVVSTLTVAGAWLWLSPLGTQQVTASTSIAASLFYANWSIMVTTGDYFAEAAALNPLLHTWSLSVEEQFYLVFPSLLAVVWLLARRLRWSGRVTVTTLLVALAVASFILACVFSGPLASRSDTAAGWAFYGSFFRVWEFAIGGFLAVAVRRRPMVDHRLLVGLGVVGSVAIALSAFVISGSTPFPGPWTLLPVLGTALVIYAGSGLTHGVVPGLASRPMVWLGDLSYSWYLWHWPVIVFTSVLTRGSAPVVLVAAFASLVPAWLSFVLVEQPIRHSRIKGWHAVGLAAVCISIPVAAALALNTHANRAVDAAEQAVEGSGEWRLGFPEDSPRQPADLFEAALIAQQGQWEVYGQPCLGGGKDEPIGSCVFFDGPGRPRALLVGDSHAGAYAPGFIAAARQLGYSVEVITTSACPFTELPIARGGKVDQTCQKRYAQIWDHIREEPPALMAVANRSPRFMSSPIRLADELEPNSHPPCAADPSGTCLDHDVAVQGWADSLTHQASELAELRVPLVLLQTAPENRYGLESCVIGTDVDLDCLTTPRSTSWDRRVDVIEAEDRVADEFGVHTYDPFDVFCDESTCHQYLRGQFRYRNDDHLNPSGSELLTEPIRRVLAAAAPPPGDG